MVMCGMTLGLIPISMVIIPVGTTAITLVTIPAWAQAIRGGVHRKLTPTIEPLRLLQHAVTDKRVVNVVL